MSKDNMTIKIEGNIDNIQVAVTDASNFLDSSEHLSNNALYKKIATMAIVPSFLKDGYVEAPTRDQKANTYGKSSPIASQEDIAAYTDWADVESHSAIKKINSVIVQWLDILSATIPSDDDSEGIGESSEGNVMPIVASMSLASDTIGTGENGEKVVIPAGEYTILGKKTENGIDYVLIEIDGKKVWVMVDKEGNIIPYKSKNPENSTASLVGVVPAIGAATEGSSSDENDATLADTPGDVTSTEESNVQDNSAVIANATGDITQGEGTNVHENIADLNRTNGDVSFYVNGNEVHDGEYSVIDTYSDGINTYAVILVDGVVYRVKVDGNGDIIPGQTAEPVGNDYTVVNGDTTIKTESGDVVVHSGRYHILATKTVNGQTYVLICVDGAFYWVPVDGNINIIPNGKAEIANNTYLFLPVGTKIIVDGKEITLNGGNYTILATKEIDGKTYALIKDGDNYYWVLYDGNINNSTAYKANITSRNGYTFYDIQTINGETYGLIYKDGKYYWIKLDKDGNPIPGTEKPAILENGTYHLENPLDFNVDGEDVNVVPGDYPITSITNLPDGTKVYCILVNGKYVLIHVDGNGNILDVSIQISDSGVYSLNTSLNIIDNAGNIVGTIKPGTYHIYAVRYDKDGNIIAVRISPDGEEERWIYIRDKDNNMIGEFNILSKDDKNNPNSPVQFAFFKNNMALFGILLGIVTIMGVAIIYKRKKDRKNKETTDEYDKGEFPIYEKELDEDGNIKALRITNNEDEDDYWVEV